MARLAGRPAGLTMYASLRTVPPRSLSEDVDGITPVLQTNKLSREIEHRNFGAFALSAKVVHEIKRNFANLFYKIHESSTPKPGYHISFRT